MIDMREEALLLGSEQTNVGVFTPAADSSCGQGDLAALCITAGLLHHVGPHRMHVLLARALAKQGISTLRFDLSGVGDSSVRTDDLPADEVPLREINDAIDALESRGFRRFILFGVCSGALHALKAAEGSPKIAGLVLVNTGTDDSRTEVDPQPAAKMYLRHSLWKPEAWKNFFTGKVHYRALASILFSALVFKIKGKNKNLSSAEERIRATIQPYVQQGTSILMVLSDRHTQIYTLYGKILEDLQCAQFQFLVYENTDHLFTSLSLQQDLIDRVCQWSDGLARDENEVTASGLVAEIG